MRDYDIAPGVVAAVESFRLPEKLGLGLRMAIDELLQGIQSGECEVP